MTISDLDELVNRCRNEDARQYIFEAVACYKSGAFRACIVAAWIGVVYDIISKIKDLSVSGDAEASIVINKISGLQAKIQNKDQIAIRQILDIERDILKIAQEDFGFIDGHQRIDLERLQDDRNRCAHPSYQSVDQPYLPSSELARSHLFHAVHNVLALPPVQGKAATEHIVKLVESIFFPLDVPQAKIQLRLGGLERPKDSLVRSVVDHLIFELFEGASALKAQKRTIIAISAIHQMYPGLTEPRMRKAFNAIGRRIPDPDQVIFFALHKFIAQTWSWLDQDNRARLGELLRQAPGSAAARIIPMCVDISELYILCENKIKEMDYENVGLIIQEMKTESIVNRAIDIFCVSPNWDRANSCYEIAIKPILSGLDEEKLKRILLSPINEKSDLRGSHAFNKFVRYVYENERIPRSQIIELMTENGMGAMIERIIKEYIAQEGVPF